jgi:hypothetical protein
MTSSLDCAHISQDSSESADINILFLRSNLNAEVMTIIK